MGDPSRVYEFGPFRLDVAESVLRRDGKALALTPKAFDLLVYFVERPNRLLNKNELISALWPGTIVEEANLAFQVSALRKVLDENTSEASLIETVPTKGYRFVTPVTAVEPRSELPHTPRASPWTRGATSATVALVLALVVGGSWFAMRRPLKNADDPPRGSGDLVRLTFDAGLQTNVTWAPDGQSIAYASDKAGNFDIWTRALTGEPVQITNTAASDTEPAWSPDGSTIVFHSDQDGGGLFVVPAQGGAERRLTTFGWHPQWAPDGSRILFAESRVHPLLSRVHLFTVSPGGGRPVSILGSLPDSIATRIERVSWRPDSREVSLLLGAGGDLRITTATLDGAVRSDVALPDRSWRDFRWDGPRTIWIERYDASGTNLWRLQLTADGHGIESEERITAGAGWSGGMALSPDGSRLLLPKEETSRRLWVVPFDAGSRRVLGAGSPVTGASVRADGVDLSRDGARLTFVLNRPGDTRSDLWVSDLTGGVQQRLARDDAERQAPRWSNDGRYLAYRWIGLVGTTVAASIGIWNVAAGHEQLLVAPGDNDIWVDGWSPDGRRLMGTMAYGTPPQMALVEFPVSAMGQPMSAGRILASDAQNSLWESSYSPDGRWIVFEAIGSGKDTSIIDVMPATGAPKSAWVALTSAAHWADKPRWAADGRTVYFVQDAGGFWNVWGISFDPVAGRPVGEPFQVTHFDSVRHQLSPELAGAELGVSAHHLVLTVGEATGSIWMLDRAGR